MIERLQPLGPEFRALGVERLGLFGSFYRDEASAEGDVDILVEFIPGQKSFDNFMHLAERLERVLGGRWSLSRASPFVHISVLAFSKRRSMSSSPAEYLRHILDEIDFLLEQVDTYEGGISSG